MPPSQTTSPFQPYGGGASVPGQNAPLMPPQPKKSSRFGLIVTLVALVLLFLGAAGFGLWAFASRQDYKEHADQKAAKAAEIAAQQESTKKDNEFLEKEKNPLKTYEGPAAYGSLNVSYPKTWSAYIVQTDRSSTPLDGYFHPNFVPGIQSNTAFALRLQVTSLSYQQEMKQFDGKVKSQKVTIAPFVAKNVPNVIGARIEGEINQSQKGTMILLPLRDKTVKISTESQQFLDDFNNLILANLKFVP